jgi:3-oxoacyl-[acyl-carrier protein] reductase
MLLKDKVAVVYGAGSIGGAVARAFGAEGARVFIGDRTAAKAEALAGEIEATGGSAHGIEVDALDEARCRSSSTRSSPRRGDSTSPST